MSKNFWIGYMLFFIFPFPMIFEYLPMIGTGEYADYSDARWAFIYLGLGFVFWTLSCFGYYRLFVKPVFVRKSINAIRQNGVRSVAKIDSRKFLKEEKGIHTLELTIRLKNLAGTLIKIPCKIQDRRPEQNRFTVGRELPMRIDPQLRRPYILPEDGDTKQNNRLLAKRLTCLIGLIIFCFGYLLFSYWLQSRGHGWRFLHFWHPWVTIPMWALFYGGIFRLIMVYLPASGEMLGFEDSKDIELVFRGKRAMAIVQSTKQTGTYVNEQPEILFEISFQDDQGVPRVGAVKTLVNLLQLHNVQQPTRYILYLPKDPQKIIFAEDYLPDLPEAVPANLN